MIETALGIIVLIILISVLGRLIRLVGFGLDKVLEIVGANDDRRKLK